MDFRFYLTITRGLTTNMGNSGPPTMMDLCNVGGVEAHTPRIRESSSTQSREEIKYMFIHEYADGLNKLLETQWYTVHGIERLFAHHELCEEFAGTLELFANTKSNQFEQMRWLPPAESKLVWQLMQLPRCVSNPNPADTDLQTVIARLEVLECLITGRTILRSPTSFGPPQPGMDPRQSFFWRNLGDAVTQSTLCNAHWGLPTVPNAFSNAEVALRSMKSVLDNIEPRDVLYSAAVLRHLGPRHVAALSTAVTYPVNMPQLDPQGQQERAKVAVAKRFLEDEASGRGTTQVIQRVCGMVVRSWSYWRLT